MKFIRLPRWDLVVCQPPGVVFIQNLLEERIFAGLSLLHVKHGQDQPDHRPTVRGVAESDHHEVPVLHQDAQEDLHLRPRLQSQYEPGVEPLLAGHIIHHQALLLKAECLPGESLLDRVGIGQLEDEVEEVGVPVLEGVLGQDVVDHVLHRGGHTNTDCEVLDITHYTSNMNPANIRNQALNVED